MICCHTSSVSSTMCSLGTITSAWLRRFPHRRARHSFFAVVLGTAFGGSALQSKRSPASRFNAYVFDPFAGAVAPRSSIAAPTMPAFGVLVIHAGLNRVVQKHGR
jgi:hypothetical protein